MTVIAYALSRGVTMTEIEAFLGTSCIELLRPEARPPEAVMPRIVALLGEKFPGEPFALEIARAAPFSFFGGLANGAQFADDLRSAIGLLTKNCAIISDQLELTFHEGPSGPKIVSSHPLNYIDNGRSAEVGSALISRLISEFLGIADSVERVTFSHAPNCDVSHYAEYFGVPVDFNADGITVVFNEEKLKQRIKHANVDLFNYVRTHLSGIQKQIRAANEPRELSALRSAAAENARAGVFSTATVAAAANMSMRTAQRVTAEHGTTVQGVIDSVREHRATELLRDDHHNIGSIAFLLGYSDERSFRRAFRRWTGKTPSEFRRSLNEQKGS